MVPTLHWINIHLYACTHAVAVSRHQRQPSSLERNRNQLTSKRSAVLMSQTSTSSSVGNADSVSFLIPILELDDVYYMEIRDVDNSNAKNDSIWCKPIA